MRRAAHVDGNHAAVVAALRHAGIGVLSLAGVGNGCPDLLCAFRDVTVLLEVKNPDSDRGAPSKVSKGTAEFIASWPGLVYVVWSAEEAVRVVVDAAGPCKAQSSA